MIGTDLGQGLDTINAGLGWDWDRFLTGFGQDWDRIPTGFEHGSDMIGTGFGRCVVSCNVIWGILAALATPTRTATKLAMSS